MRSRVQSHGEHYLSNLSWAAAAFDEHRKGTFGPRPGAGALAPLANVGSRPMDHPL